MTSILVETAAKMSCDCMTLSVIVELSIGGSSGVMTIVAFGVLRTHSGGIAVHDICIKIDSSGALCDSTK